MTKIKEHKCRQTRRVDLVSVFAFVPVVSSVDGMDDISFNQTGILLTVPTPSSATRTIRPERGEQSLFLGCCCCWFLFFNVTVKIGKTISGPDLRVRSNK